MGRERQQSKTRSSVKLPFSIVIIFPVVLILVLLFLFSTLSTDYKEKIKTESAAHILELEYQVKLLFEQQIQENWICLASIASNLMDRKTIDNDQVIDILKQEQELWSLSNLIIYTEKGHSIDLEGRVMSNDKASSLVVDVMEKKRLVSIIESSVTFTMALDKPIYLDDDCVLALSITRDLAGFLDSLNFTAFNKSSYIYLTQEKGTVISRQNHPMAPQLYNITSRLDSFSSIVCITEPKQNFAQALAGDIPTVFLSTDKLGVSKYIAITSVITEKENWSLVLVVPESEVNAYSDDFGKNITSLSLATLGAFLVLTILFFTIFYFEKRKRFNKAIMARDKMFDYLGNKTSYGFELMNLNEARPLFYTSNILSLLGEEYFGLFRTKDGCFKLVGQSGEEKPYVKQINLELMEWDGEKEFHSSYIAAASDLNPLYYVVSFYNSDGQYISIVKDVTQQKRNEETLKNALNIAQAASTAKTLFLSNMSHDIRTPMNAIINMTRFAINSRSDEEKTDYYLKCIEESSNHLLQLINDVLDISRIESGRMVINKETFDLASLIKEVCDIIRPLCRKKGLGFQLQTQDLTSSLVLRGTRSSCRKY